MIPQNYPSVETCQKAIDSARFLLDVTQGRERTPEEMARLSHYVNEAIRLNALEGGQA